ncbi:MAG: NUDIX hydrolase [Duodenibacillus sp.]
MTQIPHPCLDENGKPVVVRRPTRSTSRQTWLDSQASAVCSRTEAPDLPELLNGVVWDDTVCLSEDPMEWIGRYPDALPDEPDFVLPPGFRATSGCAVIEPDGRVWVALPTNQFCNQYATFPKGRLEPVLSLLQNACKETWEETGLVVEPVAFLADIRRTRVVTRYYVARRVSGTPALCGWETQGVGLVPVEQLADFVNSPNDRKLIAPIAEWLATNDFPSKLR